MVLTHGLHSNGGISLTINMITVFLGSFEEPGKKRDSAGSNCRYTMYMLIVRQWSKGFLKRADFMSWCF